MASYYKKLKRDLTAAAADGLITAQQADAVYESVFAKRMFASFRAAHWIGVIAGLFIAGGLCMIIASNWDKLGSIAKIAGFLALYAAAGAAAIRWADKPSVGVPAEVIWFFMPPLGIGLYAQIFQLSGDPVKPFAAWAAISLPLAFLSRRNVAAGLSALLLTFVAYFGAFKSGTMFSLVGGRLLFGETQSLPPWTHWLAVAAVFAALFWVYFARLRPGGREAFTGAALLWIFVALQADTFLELHSPVFKVLAGVSLSVLWLGLTAADEKPPRLPLWTWFAVVYVMTFFWHYKSGYSPRGDDSSYGVAAAWLIFAAAVALTVLRPVRAAGEDKTAGLAAKAILVVSMVSAFLLFDANEAAAKAIAVIANVLIVAAGLGLILTGSRESDEKRINMGVAVVFLIILTRFLDLFGTLLRTGAAFIFSGLVLAALAYFVNRTRKALIEAAVARRPS